MNLRDATAEEITALTMAHPDHQRQVDAFVEIVSAKPCAVCGDPAHAAVDGHESYESSTTP
jgi:hypothetical protein